MRIRQIVPNNQSQRDTLVKKDRAIIYNFNRRHSTICTNSVRTQEQQATPPSSFEGIARVSAQFTITSTTTITSTSSKEPPICEIHQTINDLNLRLLQYLLHKLNPLD